MTPIVYVPGWGCDGDLVAETVDALSGGTDQVVVDLAGAATLDAMVTATQRVLPERCALVGVSMGGWIAQRVAAAVPERIDRLVLASTWSSAAPTFLGALRDSIALVGSGTWGDDLRNDLLANFSPARRDGPLPDRLLAMLERVGRDALLAQAEAMLAEPDVTSTHASIAAPTLVLAADGDVFFSLDERRATALSLVGCNRVTVGFEVVSDSNHNISWEQPERFTAAVRRWCGPDAAHGIEATS